MDCIVSIVIPVYNAEQNLEECIKHILSQTYTGIEVICVDDGSGDNSLEILKRTAYNDQRIKVISQQNQGAGAARNAGAQLATGKYIIFLDSDDVFEPDMIELMIKHMEQTNSDVGICLYDAFDDTTGDVVSTGWMMPTHLLNGDLFFSPSDKKEILFQIVQGWPWDKIFRTDFVRTHELFYPDFPNSQDLVFTFQALALAGQICVINRVLVHRRVNQRYSISNSRAASVESPYNAVVLLIEMMKKRGIYELYKTSLYSWIMNFLIWHMRTLNGNPQKRCYELMKNKWFCELDFDSFPEDIYHLADYNEYKRILGTPYWRYSMAKKTKSFLKKILPPPVSTFNREMARVLDSVAALRSEIAMSSRENDEQIKSISASYNNALGEIERLNSIVSDQQVAIDSLQEQLALLKQRE